MGLKLVTAPTEFPVSLVEAKLHLREDFNEQDDLINILIAAATSHAEQFLGRALIAQTWDLYVDQFPISTDTLPNEIRIPKPPLIAVTGVFYRDSSDVEQEFASSSYTVDDSSAPARVVLASSASWPTTRTGANAVRIRFKAGYLDNMVSPASGEVPSDIRSAILLQIGALYANREQVVVGQTNSQLSWGAEQLLRLRRADLSMA